MLVRIIYRPSYPRMTVTRSATAGLRSSRSPGPPNPSGQSAAKRLSQSHKAILRSLALVMVRLGFGAMAMAAWRIASDLGLPLPFVIKTGVLIHWQVWFGSGVLLVALAGSLARRLRLGGELEDGTSDRAEEAA